MSDVINPISAGWQIWRAIRSTRPPRPRGHSVVDHEGLRPVLAAVRDGGVAQISQTQLAEYVEELQTTDPDELTRDHALAYWINLYNALALDAAATAHATSEVSVLRLPKVFHRPVATVAGEHLSLHAIEHGKVRRFGDPRIHAALVCGSVSCPTLRFEPFDGDKLETQLEEQMQGFIERGGARVDGDTLYLSRIFSWYAGDFTRKMPAFLPSGRKELVAALRPWLPAEAAATTRLKFMAYDWALGCSVG